MAPLSADAASFLGHVQGGRRSEAIGVVVESVRAGRSVAAVLEELLVPVQDESGRRWQTSTHTVSHEHTVTGVVEEALGILALYTGRSRTSHRVALVCAEGEWHTTPARMAALTLRAAGWHVDFLGGSTPPDHLERALAEMGAGTLVISATMPLSLLGVPAHVRTARSLQVPVLVGGRAFGSTDHRARMLGAHGWARTPTEGDAVLRRWLDEPPTGPAPQAAPALLAERHALAAVRDDVIVHAARRLRDDVASPRAQAHGHEPGTDLDELLRFTDVALLVDDHTVITDHVLWLAQRAGSAETAVHDVVLALAALRDATAGHLPRTRAVLHAALTDVTAAATRDDERGETTTGTSPPAPTAEEPS